MAVPTGIVCHTTQGTVGTVAAALGSVTCDWFRVEAAAANTGKIYLGSSTVAPTAFFVALASGTNGLACGYDVKLPGAYDNARNVNGKAFDLSKWYVVGSTTGQVYNITYFQRLNDG